MILRALWISGFATHEEVKQIILDIELQDNTRIKDISQIFEEEWMLQESKEFDPPITFLV